MIKKNSCPKCGGGVIWYEGKYGGYELAQCQVCNIVPHTGSKLCQMNICEWHEICVICGEEVCGDYQEDKDGNSIHIKDCPDQTDLRMHEILGI